jgi:hypothetical protein
MLKKSLDAWRRRGLPVTLAGLRGCKASYSQFGEDAVVDGVMGARHPRGFYVDVGSFHPIKWSNTYRFYLAGWHGICVDPNPAFTELWKKTRPRDTFLNLAITSP